MGMKEDHIDWMNKTKMSKAIHTVESLRSWFCPGMGDPTKYLRDSSRGLPVPLKFEFNGIHLSSEDLAPVLQRFKVNLRVKAMGSNQLINSAKKLRRNKGAFFEVVAEKLESYGKKKWCLVSNAPNDLPKRRSR